MDTVNKELNIEDLTVGQVEFICDYTGRTLNEFLTSLGSSEMTARDIVAVLAVIENPTDPEAAVPIVRNMKVADVDVSGLTN